VPHAGDVGAPHGIVAGQLAFAGFSKKIEHVTVNAHLQIGLGLGQLDCHAIQSIWIPACQSPQQYWPYAARRSNGGLLQLE
jgi:hypothetical protein